MPVSVPFLPISLDALGRGGGYGQVRFPVSCLKELPFCGREGAPLAKGARGSLPALPAEADSLRPELRLDAGICRRCQVHCGVRLWKLDSTRSSSTSRAW